MLKISRAKQVILELFKKLRHQGLSEAHAGESHRIPPSRRMIILGNAPLKKNMSDYIDASALVVRFNECKNLGRKVGMKTDFLCINNLDRPANRYIRKQLIKKLPFIDSIQEIWMPRCSSVMIENRRKIETSLNEEEFRDKAEDIILSNSLTEKKIIHFSKELNLQVINNLSDYSSDAFLEPSTGVLAIEYVLSENRFNDYDKILLGFNFKGWFGHPWDAEERLLMDYAANRKDFYLEP
jgi:hypothetical protein